MHHFRYFRRIFYCGQIINISKVLSLFAYVLVYSCRGFDPFAQYLMAILQNSAHSRRRDCTYLPLN